MIQISETVVFFGSGPVAAESLRLIHRDFSVEAIITKPRSTHHRGEVPMLSLAQELGLPVWTAPDKEALARVFDQKPFRSRLAVLVDFGIIVSQNVINYFPLGIVNSHFSLLPQWRGADPITFAVLSGQKYTGVSLMLLVPKMDEGPLLAQQVFSLNEHTTAPELTHALIKVSHGLLTKTIPAYVRGSIKPYPQDSTTQPTYSRKLTKDDGVIDWEKTAEQIEREIRAFKNWPKSRTTLAGQDVIITTTHISRDPAYGRSHIGAVSATSDGHIIITTGQGALIIDKLKPAGKSEMTAKSFLAGYSQKL